MGAASLPAPRVPGRYRIALVCLGNICRSPIAAAVLRARVAEAGLDDRVEIVSGGTGTWHLGEPMDRRAAATLTAAGYGVDHTAQRIEPSWFDDCDLILAMDAANHRDIAALGTAVPEEARDEPSRRVEDDRLRMFRDFDPVDPGGDVPDPFYGGPEGFDRVLEMVERTCDELVAALR